MLFRLAHGLFAIVALVLHVPATPSGGLSSAAASRRPSRAVPVASCRFNPCQIASFIHTANSKITIFNVLLARS